MSSHHDWVEEITAEHDKDKPFAPENGQPLRFKVGDPVIYTNDAGFKFRRRITGFFERTDKACGLYARGARYMLDWSTPWFPVPESRLQLDGSRLKSPQVSEAQ